MNSYKPATTTQGISAAYDRSPLEMSWLTLLSMAALCCLLAVGVVFQIAFLKPTPKGAIAFRSIVIPEAGSSISDGFYYRHFISQIVQNSRRYNFFEGRDLSDLIIRVSIEENIDPLLVAAIVKAESTFYAGAVSHRGAHGLMQIQSGTAEYISDMLDEPWQGERFLYDPEYNLRLGICYLKYLSKKFEGNLDHVLAAYNWGPTNVKKVGGLITSMPSDTRKYVTSVTANHKRWKAELKLQRAALDKSRSEDLA